MASRVNVPISKTASASLYASLLAACDFSYQRTQKVFKSRHERAIVAFEEQLEKN